jgi:secondary thiamine-phosphate synthase enzyme
VIRFPIRTRAREELLDITATVRDAVRASGVRAGLIHLWSTHTTCALTVNEGADPDVALDIVSFMRDRVPRAGAYRHDEGNSDSHIKTSLFGPGLSLIIDEGDLVLGTWQHVFLAEWDGPRSRVIAALILPASALEPHDHAAG